ncbi:hypothetical protein BDA96_09G231200 [Sorghum bicolor]|uniref:Uncharacterized protein n=1 Tax=Sorghum bicolor TaxID=4558 RepID=A0A921U520_SORBI|nr:hypothetical protein BDA96_09G231200 [Sorghum bicolor]
MSRAASTRPLQTREWRRAWNVALEWEQKAGTARKTSSAASGREKAPRWSMRAANAVGCSGTRRVRSAVRSGGTSGKSRARARRYSTHAAKGWSCRWRGAERSEAAAATGEGRDLRWRRKGCGSGGGFGL